MRRGRYPAVAALLLLGCGSADSSRLLSGGASSAGGGQAGASAASGGSGTGSGGLGSGGIAGAGGESVGGAGSGGTTTTGGAGGVASGGVGSFGSGGDTASGGVASGGTGGAGGGAGADAGGPSAGGAHDSGVVPPPDASLTVLEPGGIISSQCSTCGKANCMPEALACQADADCTKMYECVTNCFIPIQCAACTVGNTPGAALFTALQCCTSQKCTGLCPSLNGGVIGCQ